MLKYKDIDSSALEKRRRLVGTQQRIKIDSKTFKNLMCNKHAFSVLIDRNPGTSSLNKKENRVATFLNHDSNNTGLRAAGTRD